MTKGAKVTHSVPMTNAQRHAAYVALRLPENRAAFF